MGIDGGGTMPELRRQYDSIRYDKKFQEDLFDLWYWFRLSKCQGTSIHVHIDECDEKKPGLLKEYQKILRKYKRNDIR
jgi:gamma-glutamyl:cysteine ligase YbdK (ATP-grasp superfamily)